jgi:hypothetical protein
MDGIYVLTEQDYLSLKRDHGAAARRLTNLEKRLSSSGMRRHQSVFMPAKRWPVRFVNQNSGTVPAYGVMRVTGATSAIGEPTLTIDKPNTSFQRRYLVNGPYVVQTTATGWGTWLDDADLVLYESGTPAYGESWGPADGQWSLKKWRYGFTIQGGNNTTALTTVARQIEVNEVWGQTQGAIAKGSTTGILEVYDGNDTEITSTTITAIKNKFCDVADNKKASVRFMGGSWYVNSGEGA